MLSVAGVFVAVGILTVFVIATDAGPRLASDDGCAGRETFCAVVATDDPGATLQHLGATWRRGDGQRYRVRVVVAPEKP